MGCRLGCRRLLAEKSVACPVRVCVIAALRDLRPVVVHSSNDVGAARSGTVLEVAGSSHVPEPDREVVVTIRASGVYVAPSADVDETAVVGADTAVWHLAQIRERAVLGP